MNTLTLLVSSYIYRNASKLFCFKDCWADHRDDNGNLVPDKSRFPELVTILAIVSINFSLNNSGMAPVIKYINSKGFKVGMVR